MSKTKTGKKSGKKIYEKDIRGSIGKVIMECSVSRKGARIRLDIPELKRIPSKSDMEKLIKEMKRDSCEEIAMAIADIIKREFEPKYVEEANELSQRAGKLLNRR